MPDTATHCLTCDSIQQPQINEATDEVAALFEVFRTVEFPAGLAQLAAALLEEAATGQPLAAPRRDAAAAAARQLRAVVHPTVC
ncbi:hypothetical protein ABZ543_34685 [Streptomyces roseifaciens]